MPASHLQNVSVFSGHIADTVKEQHKMKRIVHTCAIAVSYVSADNWTPVTLTNVD